jgi:hypothetical protein
MSFTVIPRNDIALEVYTLKRNRKLLCVCCCSVFTYDPKYSCKMCDLSVCNRCGEVFQASQWVKGVYRRSTGRLPCCDED